MRITAGKKEEKKANHVHWHKNVGKRMPEILGVELVEDVRSGGLDPN